MDKIKNLQFFKVLTGKDLKSRAIKLCIVLFFMCLSYIAPIFVYIAFSLICIYLLFEFSMDSIFWICLIAIFIRSEVFLTYAIMWEMSGILIIKLIIDLKNKKIDYKNWRFITIILLFFVLLLLILLPLCKYYSFIAQFGNLALFVLAVLGVFYIKEVKIKQFISLIPICILTLCIFYHLFTLFNLVNFGYFTSSSFGEIGRFDVFARDPNFTGAILICAITCWHVAYKKEYIKKLHYFIVLTMLFIFSIMTVSKAMLLVLAVFAFYVFIDNIIRTIKSRNGKNLIELIWYGVALILACLIAYQYVDALCFRLFNFNKVDKGWWSGGENEAMSNFTTGRTDLWIMYLKAMCSSIQVFLFGYGTAAKNIAPGDTHSMPISYMFRLGVLPTIILLAIFVIAVWPYIKKAKLYNFIPLLCISLIYCSIGSINAKYIYMFAIIYITFCCNGIEYDIRNKQS